MLHNGTFRLYFGTLIFLGLLGAEIRGQENAIYTVYQDYFQSDRKTVHLHLNKTVFTKGEPIWFATYVYNQTKNAVSQESEYVYVDLLNTAGEVIDSKTVLYAPDAGHNNFFLDGTLEAGPYFLQAYTAAMPYFEEDDSSVYPIKVVDLNTGFNPVHQEENGYKSDSVNVSLKIEGNQLIENVFGTCAVRLWTNKGNPFIPDSVGLFKGSGQKIRDIAIDALGIGVFSLVPSKRETLEIKVFYGASRTSLAIPKPVTHGYSISVDKNPNKKQVNIGIHTNGYTPHRRDSLVLLLHKDGNMVPFPLKNPSRANNQVILPYDIIYPGINGLTLIQGKNTILAERHFYKEPSSFPQKPQIVRAVQHGDSIRIFWKTGKSPSTKTPPRLSLSIRPKGHLPEPLRKNMFFTTILAPYFKDGEWQALKDIDITSNKDVYNLDRAMFFAEPKYKWPTLLNPNLHIPVEASPNSTILGHVNAKGPTKDSLAVLLFSPENGLFMTTKVSNTGSFKFENILVSKKSDLLFTLLTKEGNPVKGYFAIHSQSRPHYFRHRYVPKKVERENPKAAKTKTISNPPKRIVELEEVTVVQKKLKYQDLFKDYYGFRPDSHPGLKTLEDFIIRQGYAPIFVDIHYEDPRRAGSPQLAKIGCGYTFPAVVVNGRSSGYIMEFSDLRMEMIDEIYFNSGSFKCSNGIFVVMTKEAYGLQKTPYHLQVTKKYNVTSGYDYPEEFTRPHYLSTHSMVFKNFGIVAWYPLLLGNEKGTMAINIPNDGLDRLSIFVEGWNGNGHFMTRDITLDLTQPQ
ncbi:MAG: hypothetical protein AB3N16_11030 [Flavobacteriaceae bacterium]